METWPLLAPHSLVRINMEDSYNSYGGQWRDKGIVCLLAIHGKGSVQAKLGEQITTQQLNAINVKVGFNFHYLTVA